jgi:peroxiredoxin
MHYSNKPLAGVLALFGCAWLAAASPVSAQSKQVTFTATSRMTLLPDDPEELPFQSAAPDFTLQDINGKKITLADLKGKTVIIHCWNPATKNNDVQLTEFYKAAKDYQQDDRLVFLSVAGSKRTKVDQPFMPNCIETDVPANTADKGAQAFLRDYKIRTIPRTIILSRNGEVLTSAVPDTSFGTFFNLWRLQQERIDVGSHQPYWDYKVREGDQLPDDLSFPVMDGKTFTTADLRGKVTLLEFTATWCSYCRKLMPHLENDIWKVFQPKGMQVFGIDFDEPATTVRKFSNEMNITYPLVLDAGGKIFKRFVKENGSLTKVMLIDRNGRIVHLSQALDAAELEVIKNKVATLLQTEKS